MVKITLAFSEEDWQEISNKAKSEERSKSGLIRFACKVYCNNESNK
jgi:hypothetical protein